MNNEWILSIITCIACGLTVSSLIFAIRKTVIKYSTFKREINKLEKYREELNKQLLELEEMKEKIEFEEKELRDKKKYEDTKILIDNLINQYKNIS